MQGGHSVLFVRMPKILVRENIRKNAPEMFAGRYSLLRSGPHFLQTPNILVQEHL